MNKMYIVLALVIAACGSNPDRPPPIEGDSIPVTVPVPADPGPYTVTIVTADSSGRLTTIVKPLDPVEEDKAEAARRAGVRDDSMTSSSDGVGTVSQAAQDPNCGGASTWIFDQPTGQRGNKICFIGGGVYDLNQIGWGDHRIKSIWPGQDQGNVTTDNDHWNPGCWWTYNINAWGSQFDLSYWYNGVVYPGSTGAMIHLGSWDCNTTHVCSHRASVTGAPLTTACHSCVTPVCLNDGFCCNSGWDQQCVNEAYTAYNNGYCSSPDYHCGVPGCL
jgi:hypothetical protein